MWIQEAEQSMRKMVETMRDDERRRLIDAEKYWKIVVGKLSMVTYLFFRLETTVDDDAQINGGVALNIGKSGIKEKVDIIYFYYYY